VKVACVPELLREKRQKEVCCKRGSGGEIGVERESENAFREHLRGFPRLESGGRGSRKKKKSARKKETYAGTLFYGRQGKKRKMKAGDTVCLHFSAPERRNRATGKGD